MSDPIALLSELIAAGRDGEAAVQRVVAAHLTALGCAVENFVYRPEEVTLREEFAGDRAIVAGERAAILARLKGSGGGRSCILFAHPDSEPVPAAQPTGFGNTRPKALVGSGLGREASSGLRPPR